MKKIIYLSLVSLISSCVSFENATLTIDKPLVHRDSATMNKPSLPVNDFNGGVFYNEKVSISKWQPSHDNINLRKSDGILKIDLNNVGADWEALDMRFEPLNFEEYPFIIVKARLSNDSPDSLKIRIDLIDEDGRMTNYNPQEHYIRRNDKYKMYKFIFDGHWEQGWPIRTSVDSKSIVSMKINFNGGGDVYKGQLLISEIFASNGVRKIDNPNNFVVFDFSDGISGWWSANNIEVSSTEEDGNDVMKLECDEVGAAWEGLGYSFKNSIDFSKTPILKVTVKSNAEGKFRCDIIDIHGKSSNGGAVTMDLKKSDSFIELFYNFENKFFQTFPSNEFIDSTQINKIKFHVNPPENPSFTGVIYIDDMMLMSIEEYQRYSKKD